MIRYAGHAVVLLAMALLAAPAGATGSLPSYQVDLAQTSVSGISSGGFMSVQFHLAHSAIVSGVGVLAGGPSGCARGSSRRALEVCMTGEADAASGHAEHDGEDAEIVGQIKELLDTRVRPAVAQDGGDITFHGFDKGVVYLHMQGACAGCPSSSSSYSGPSR